MLLGIKRTERSGFSSWGIDDLAHIIRTIYATGKGGKKKAPNAGLFSMLGASLLQQEIYET